MTRFIKLTNMILNTKYINKINIKPNLYCIQFIDKKIQGGGFLVAGFGFGNISSFDTYEEIEVCATKHAVDYKILSDWINTNS